ncbi:MAG: phosphatase PAP2 family protein [Longimicrobiales bacterium]|nr:phosphatase PAP2 family protein [Longimicrobiales bacterium]
MSSLLLHLGAYDERLLLLLLARRRPLLDLLMRGVTHLADGAVAVAFALVMMSGVIPEVAGVGARIAWTLGISHFVVQGMKRIFTRRRPHFAPGFAWLVEVPDRFSFPSGHATAAMSLALPLALFFGGITGSLVLTLGALVGLSRCYLGVHYPGDVLAGWGLAASTLAVVVASGLA